MTHLKRWSPPCTLRRANPLPRPAPTERRPTCFYDLPSSSCSGFLRIWTPGFRSRISCDAVAALLTTAATCLDTYPSAQAWYKYNFRPGLLSLNFSANAHSHSNVTSAFLFYLPFYILCIAGRLFHIDNLTSSPPYQSTKLFNNRLSTSYLATICSSPSSPRFFPWPLSLWQYRS